jgi:hypothetical protein
MSVTCLAASACADPCANTVVARATSPDGAREAVLFQRDCGATTGFSTQISVLAPGEKPSGGGNVFAADDDHGRAEAGDWGGPWASLRWTGPDQLSVLYAPGSRIFTQSDSVDGVRLTFEAKYP